MSVNASIPVTLPGGSWEPGPGARQVRLRPLNGADESFLLETAGALLAAQRTTAVLARCLTGPIPDPGPDDTAPDVRAMTVGDREALVLHLRRITFGDRMSCVLNCPNPGCGEKMDLDLNVSDLLSPPYPDVRPFHES